MSPYGKEYEFKPINENPLVLDFADCKYIEDVHLMLKHKFGLPDITGENWNAFWDFLKDRCYLHALLLVQIKNYHCMPKKLKEYCEMAMFRIFEKIHGEYPQITFEMLS